MKNRLQNYKKHRVATRKRNSFMKFYIVIIKQNGVCNLLPLNMQRGVNQNIKKYALLS